MSVPVSDARQVETSAAPRRARVTRTDVCVLGGTVVLWVVMMAIAGRLAGISIRPTTSWGRWDTGLYLNIADSGYSLGSCDGVPNRGPTDWCGSAGWFPGYPYLMRAGSATGLATDVVGRLISFVAMVVAVGGLWFGFLRHRPLASALPAMALAAAFPASVYYGAIFPVSTMVAGVTLALVCLDRRWWLAAGCFGALATVVYPSGVVVGAIVIVPLAIVSLGPIRVRLRAAALVAAPIAGAYILVLANYERATGAWDAWFRVQSGYGFERTLPMTTIVRQIRHLGDDAIPGAPGLQTMLVAVLVVAALVVAVRARHMLTLGEWGAVVVVTLLWLIPLTVGGDLSLYRAESLLLPVVVVLGRLRPVVIAGLVVVAVPVCVLMAELFFDFTLI